MLQDAYNLLSTNSDIPPAPALKFICDTNGTATAMPPCEQLEIIQMHVKVLTVKLEYGGADDHGCERCCPCRTRSIISWL